MHHAGHVSLAINSARAISHEIFREELLLPEQRDLLVAAIAGSELNMPRPGSRCSPQNGNADEGLGS